MSDKRHMIDYSRESYLGRRAVMCNWHLAPSVSYSFTDYEPSVTCVPCKLFIENRKRKNMQPVNEQDPITHDKLEAIGSVKAGEIWNLMANRRISHEDRTIIMNRLYNKTVEAKAEEFTAFQLAMWSRFNIESLSRVRVKNANGVLNDAKIANSTTVALAIDGEIYFLDNHTVVKVWRKDEGADGDSSGSSSESESSVGVGTEWCGYRRLYTTDTCILPKGHTVPNHVFEKQEVVNGRNGYLYTTAEAVWENIAMYRGRMANTDLVLGVLTDAMMKPGPRKDKVALVLNGRIYQFDLNTRIRLYDN